MAAKAAREREANDPTTDAAALLLRLGVIVLSILLPCAAVVSRRPLFVLTPIGLILVVLGSRLAPYRRPRTISRLGRACASPLGMATILFVLWAGMSLVWTPFPAVAVDRFLKTAGTVLLALVALGSLPNQVRVSNANLLPIGVAATALAIFAVAVIAPAIARTEDIDTNTVDRATIGLVILVWPALGALAIRERMATAGIVAVAVSVAAVAVWMPAALAALILAIIAFSFAFSSAEKTGLALGAVVAAFVLLAPALPLLANLALGDRLNSFGPLSHFSSWAGVVKSDGFKLVTGHGFDTAARAYEAGRLGASPPRGLFFELWYELGVVGAGLAAVLAFLAFSIAGRASPALAPFLLAALSCIAALGAAGQSISQLWWLTLICVAAVSFALVMRCEHRADRVRAHMLGATVSSG